MKRGQAMDQPLSEAELDQLADGLAVLGPEAMNLEQLDGYFSALHCSPEMLMPNEYLAPVLGSGEGFADQAQAAEVMGLVMRHWNTVGHELEQSLTKKDLHLPLLYEGEDGIAHGNDWALGFMRGVSLSPHVWDEVMDDEEQVGMLVPMMVFAHEHDQDPDMRPDPITPDKRERFIELMAVGLTQVYRYFAPHRRASAESVASPAPRRSTPKVGRNEPCPCGSGKKFKRCCGGPSAETMH